MSREVGDRRAARGRGEGRLVVADHRCRRDRPRPGPPAGRRARRDAAPRHRGRAGLQRRHRRRPRPARAGPASARAAGPAGRRRRWARACWCTATPRSSPGTTSVVGQVLLTLDDVTRRSHYRNAHQTFAKLLELGVVPVVNENDTVATTEIRFGDNDRLAALVAHLVHADLLVLLSDVDGLYDAHPDTRRLGPHRRGRLARPTWPVSGSAGPAPRASAPAACRPSSRPPGSPPAPASRWCSPPRSRRATRWPASRSAPCSDATGKRRPTRLLWLAHATEAKGRLTLDDGAVRAVTERRASLLAAGIVAVAGGFAAGDPVDLVDHRRRGRWPAGWSTSTPRSSRAARPVQPRPQARARGGVRA